MYHDLGEVKPALHFPSDNNLTAPRPINSSKVKYALSNQPDLLDLQIPRKDERLLEILIDRGEEEKHYWKRRLENDLTWEKERLERNMERRDKDRQHQFRTKILREEDLQSVKQVKFEKEEYFREKRRYFEEEHKRVLERAHKSTERERKLKEEKLAQKREQERQLKERQEKNWWSVHQAVHTKRYNKLQTNDQKRKTAMMKKEELLIDEAYRIAFENKDSKDAFKARQSEMERDTQEDLEAMIQDLDERHATALQNFEQQLLTRDGDLKQRKGEREQKHDHAQQKLTEAYDNYMIERQTLMLRREQKLREAKQALVENLGDISHRTKEKREEKVEIANEITRQITKVDEGWKKSIKKSIEQREKRMAATQQKRRENMEQTRKVALDTRLLRTTIREKYGLENFDRKSRQVQNFHKIGHKHVPKDWNESLISLL